MGFRAWALLALAVTIALSLAGCPKNPEGVRPQGQTKLTLLHTSDIHSRLFPYPLQITQSDAALGLGVAGSVATVGGASRIAYVVNRERARSDRVLHIDGGDCFQGAPVFNFFDGEAEVRTMSAMGIDAQCVANHEFDKGALNLRNQVQKWATFPSLTANYLVEDVNAVGDPDLDNVLTPFHTFDVRGLKVGVIGMGNLSSLSSLFERPSRLGVTPLETIDIAQTYIDLLRPLVDVIVFVTHLGLNADEEMIRKTTGIDVVLGGHNHIVLQPPKMVEDCGGVDQTGQHYVERRDAKGENTVRRLCNPRRVILAHSGAFAKYVGRLDLVLSNEPADLPATYDPLNGYEVLSHQYQLFPITADLPEDQVVAELLEPYKSDLDVLVDLDLLVGYSRDGSRRFGTGGGDSPLGNLIAAGMINRLGVETDFALTNTTGIRADMTPGPVSIEQMFNIFPFDNSITKMQLSGLEVQDMFDFVARRSASRGCATQVQIDGARIVINCSGCSRPGANDIPCSVDDDCASHQCQNNVCQAAPCAEHIYIGTSDKTCKSDDDCRGANGDAQPNACDIGKVDEQGVGRCLREINLTSSYELATSTYLAGGGSGFSSLKKNTTQLDTKVQQRDALVDWVRGGKPCGYDPAAFGTEDGLKSCSVDSDCNIPELGPGFVCACPENASQDGAGTCSSQGNCASTGRCVLASCRQDVASYFRAFCAGADTSVAVASCASDRSTCQLGGEQCKFLACIDRTLGSFSDGRVRMVGK